MKMRVEKELKTLPFVGILFSQVCGWKFCEFFGQRVACQGKDGVNDDAKN